MGKSAKAPAATGDNGPRLEMWDIDRLKPYANNPRTIPEAAVKKVAGSLKEFGFQKPIVIRDDGTVVTGHVLLKASLFGGED